MTKRILILAVLLLLSSGLAAKVLYKAVSATATSQTIPLGAVSAITIANEGANEVYFELFYLDEPPTAATTSSVYLANGASLEFGGPRVYGAISIVCDTAETATVRLYYQ